MYVVLGQKVIVFKRLFKPSSVSCTTRMKEDCTHIYFQSILKMDVKKEVDEVSSVFFQHTTEVRRKFM